MEKRERERERERERKRRMDRQAFLFSFFPDLDSSLLPRLLGFGIIHLVNNQMKGNEMKDEIILAVNDKLGKRLVYRPKVSKNAYALQESTSFCGSKFKWLTVKTSKILSKKMTEFFTKIQLESAKSQLHAIKYVDHKFKI